MSNRRRMNPSETDLNVDSPAKVPRVLAAAAEAYFESASELESAWQERGPGGIWVKLGKILDRAAAASDKALRSEGWQ